MAEAGAGLDFEVCIISRESLAVVVKCGEVIVDAAALGRIPKGKNQFVNYYYVLMVVPLEPVRPWCAS